MANTTPQDLATQGNCYSTYGLLSMFEIMQITLLAQISLNSNAANDVTPQGLLTQAGCFECSTYATPGQLMVLALLRQIAGG